MRREPRHEGARPSKKRKAASAGVDGPGSPATQMLALKAGEKVSKSAIYALRSIKKFLLHHRIASQPLLSGVDIEKDADELAEKRI